MAKKEQEIQSRKLTYREAVAKISIWTKLAGEDGRIWCVRMKDDPPSATWRIVYGEKNSYQTELIAIGPGSLFYNLEYKLSSDGNKLPHGATSDGLFGIGEKVSCPQ